MRRNTPLRDRLAPPRVVVWLSALALIGFAPETETRAARARPPAPEIFAPDPKTPLEFWDAADYLVRTGQAAQAVPYLNAFLKANPDDATLLEIRDRYGVGSILRLEDDPATRPFARPIADRLAQATRRNATRPERIERFIAALTKIAGRAGLRRRAAPGGGPVRRARPGAGPGQRRPLRRRPGLDRPEHGAARPVGRPRPDRGARQQGRPPGRRRGRRARADRRPEGDPAPDLPGRPRRIPAARPRRRPPRDREPDGPPVRGAAQVARPGPARRGAEVSPCMPSTSPATRS